MEEGPTDQVEPVAEGLHSHSRAERKQGRGGYNADPGFPHLLPSIFLAMSRWLNSEASGHEAERSASSRGEMKMELGRCRTPGPHWMGEDLLGSMLCERNLEQYYGFSFIR